MSIQGNISEFTGPNPGIKDPVDPPDDDELHLFIAPNWQYDFDVESVYKIDRFRRKIRDAMFATDSVDAWSYILKERFSFGNKGKVAKEIAIFNPFGSGIDCVNKGTESCQVAANECYAVHTEKSRPPNGPLSSRRKEQIAWDYIDAVTFAKAFKKMVGRMRNEVSAIRFSESGDFRTRQDMFKLDEIARRVNVDVYTYSASEWLPWEETEHFTLNRSNDHREFGHRRFQVVDSISDIPEDGIRCPNSLTKEQEDTPTVECGDCRLCIDEDAPDIYIKNYHASDE